MAMLLLASCQKEGVLVTTNGGVSGTLTASASTLVLSKANLTDTTKVISFSFIQPSFGYSAAVTNTLQIDAAGDNWVNPRSSTLATNVLKAGYSTADFNTLLLKLNLPTGKPSQVMVRIMSTVSAGLAPVYSNVSTITATPFALISFMYIPGEYEAKGWDVASADSLISATGNGVYTAMINFPAAYSKFKITPAKNWVNSYGQGDGNAAIYNGGGNCWSPAAGLTWVTLDINAMTITYTPVKYYYSLIGNATALGWGGDTDMKYNNGTQSWNVTAALNSDGGFKVRRNHDWGTSYGYISPADGMTLTSSSGANMTVPVSGNYQVTFQLNAADLSGVTALYTVTKK